MKQLNVKKFLPHLFAIGVFVALTLSYFSPLLQSKKLKQADIVNFIGMSKELKDHRATYGEEALWTNSMFGGMPAYQISVSYTANLVRHLDKLFQGFMPNPSGYVFLYLLGFYLLLISLQIDYRLAIVGAVAFAFSSYFFIIIEAGHNSKAHTIGYMAPLLASVLLTFRGRWWLGGSLSALFTSLILYSNHPQISYYLFLFFIVLGLVKLVEAYKTATLKKFFLSVGVLCLAAMLGLATNLTTVLATYEYGKDSIRGKSELTSDLGNKTSGLDKDYATAWSYGKAESFTLLIPNFHGGSSMESFLGDKESATYKAMVNYRPKSQQEAQQLQQLQQLTTTYWGAQPFTSGPVYAGAIICFLFVVGLFLLKGYMRWWVLIATLLMLALSWGKNFMPLTDLFLEYFPGYNKFRAVSTTLVIVEFLMPLFALFALHKLLEGEEAKAVKQKSLKFAFFIVGGLSLLFALIPAVFLSFEGLNDAYIPKNFSWLLSALLDDRASLLSADAWRSFIFIALATAAIWLYLSKTIRKKQLILIVGLLILGDMWAVNKRYLNVDDFESKRKVSQPFTASRADQQILADPDPNFRVYNTTVSTFNDASTSYFHKSIGGYHGAKLKRYQELIDAHISKGNMQVFNMLNTKYVITRGADGQLMAQRNPGALANAWFVEKVDVVANADEEIAALETLAVANRAVVDARFSDLLPKNYYLDSTASISLQDYKANHLTYQSNCSSEQLAVFSEIYYDKGWNAYVDGELVPHFRANYVLRAMAIPAGSHVIEFKFEPQIYVLGERIALLSSIVLLLLLVFSLSRFKRG